MGGHTKVHLSLWLISVLIIFCQDTEAVNEVTTTSTTTPPQPPMQPIVMFGADTDKDNLKGRIPWRIMPFKTDKDKYKPYIIYPPPKSMYPPYYGKPNGYVDKDWDPPKKKDDVKHKKKAKDLDDIPKSKTDKKKTMDDVSSDKNRIMQFVSVPSYASRCLDGDKKFLDDKSECKTLKRQMAWQAKQPAMGNGYYPPRRSPWQSNSFIDTSLSSQPFDYSYPNYYPFSQTPDGLSYPYVPNGYIDPSAPPGSANPYLPPGSANPYVPPGSANPYFPPGSANPYFPPGAANPYLPPGSANPYLPPGSANPYLPPGPTGPYVPGSPTKIFTPIGPHNPYSPYQYGILTKGYKLPPYGFPYNRYPNAYNRLFANVNTESQEEENEEPVPELIKDKPQQKEEKTKSTEETKNITKDLTLIKTSTISPILP